MDFKNELVNLPLKNNLKLLFYSGMEIFFATKVKAVSFIF
ncbi:hypothetical protein SAMN05444366_1399 [Flavobacterium saccharophilum]|uniref:Uncharacterized protein n=1 Tax=Flavobacterium saccharophilum TaxID=29534 RepID=A0A1M7D4X6_9FLAO|nr:hypothetical protein SAMN05444366_1399 [Flavobacterium saccharophilum]